MNYIEEQLEHVADKHEEKMQDAIAEARVSIERYIRKSDNYISEDALENNDLEEEDYSELYDRVWGDWF